jgi:hypothetical protein
MSTKSPPLCRCFYAHSRAPPIGDYPNEATAGVSPVEESARRRIRKNRYFVLLSIAKQNSGETNRFVGNVPLSNCSEGMKAQLPHPRTQSRDRVHERLRETNAIKTRSKQAIRYAVGESAGAGAGSIAQEASPSTPKQLSKAYAHCPTRSGGSSAIPAAPELSTKWPFASDPPTPTCRSG